MKIYRKTAVLHNALIASTALNLVMSAPALAQNAPQDASGEATSEPANPGEIVVTALKSGSVRLDKVPLAIQAFNGDVLKQRNVRDGADLIQLIPGASQAQEIGAGYRIFSFRGSGAGGPIGDGLIGYYLDDTPFGVPNNQAAPPVQYFDIDRVEVLRGPQARFTGLARPPERSSTTPRIRTSSRLPTQANSSFPSRSRPAIPTIAVRQQFRCPSCRASSACA